MAPPARWTQMDSPVEPANDGMAKVSCNYIHGEFRSASIKKTATVKRGGTKTMLSRLFIIAALLAAAPAVAKDAKQRPEPKELAEYVATGEFRSCLDITRIKQSKPLDDYTILFTMRDRTVYKNVLSHRCPRLGFEESFSYTTSLPRLCRGEIITVFTTTGPEASCGLSSFERLEPKDQDAG